MGSFRECRPPSEKESGVRFMTAIRWVFFAGDRLVSATNLGNNGVRGDNGVSALGRFSSCLLKLRSGLPPGRDASGIKLS